jgi:uncharacterized membrane protein YedE/YeeE
VDKKTKQIVSGFIFGIIFGFLLQKGGVAKYHILLGVLLLEDFTVIKVMVSAILVGMIGVLTLNRLGRVELNLKPTRYAANIVGGLIFGVGFALAGYCPGTGAAALGQGNLDAIAMIVGMMLGSLLFAEMSGFLNKTINAWGDRGKLTLPELFRVPRMPFMAIMGVVLVVELIALEV